GWAHGSDVADINGDGIDDLIAGSTVNETISVLFGNAADRTATVDIANLDGSDGFVIDGGTRADSHHSVS
ncbi:hypothetical protein, partial [Planktomarina temperata]|uniref:hypothetical protein n=1 Tax=Planktomarina temperata TaxID=1284658 RepID=UPI002704A08C|nr:hypothetical protein [Planktomarina temperata]